MLLLTSFVGFVAQNCWFKILSAQVMALAFLVLFLTWRPYRRSSHNLLQTIVLVTPVLAMAWASAGGWENERAGEPEAPGGEV